MRNIITVVPQTRVNDHWISSPAINGKIFNKLVSDSRLSGRPNDIGYRFQADFYEQFACDIVSETVLNYPYPYISEKILRPISCKRMFILLGSPGTLQLLRDKGFQTFGDFIDETYDTIQSPNIRFLAVVAEIEKFCSTPLENIKAYLTSIEDRLNHNFELLKNLPQQELQYFSNLLANDPI